MADTQALQFFRSCYPALAGHPEPFPWQEELFLRLIKSDIPADAVLPTGCGKTSAMAVWLLALAWQARGGPAAVSLPRRLVWVVNRRVVVDQATDEAGTLRKRLDDLSLQALNPMRQALRMLSANGALLGVSTLRGQFADNAEWRDDPARPAVVVGTVDMIGSRLLFSGYGAGFKYRPLHAGFLAQDAILVHDEAHLEPAFQKLIEAIDREQNKRREFRRFHVMALTATSRNGDGEPFGLTEADRRPGTEIYRRIQASKGIAFHSVDSEKKLAEKIVELALAFRESGQAVLIFLRRVEDVLNVAGKLKKVVDENHVSELTGTIRGLERDQMAPESRIFARFAPDSRAERTGGTVYLVCTSAGEVGVNLSADHLVCDLVPFDSMAQRLGRVNRFGDGDARVEIVLAGIDTEKPYDSRRKQTLALLEELPRRADGRYDASPAALEGLPAEKRQSAFTPEPDTLPVNEILFDAWAMTSVREKMPGRPPVGDWLHGIAPEWEPPQTYVAWREEVEKISGMELEAKYPPEDLLDDYPLKPHELLRDSSRRVAAQLAKIAERDSKTRVWLVDAQGSVEPKPLLELPLNDPDRLRDCAILLPPHAGGLTKSGMLDGSDPFVEDPERKYDVADEWRDEDDQPRRCRRGNPPKESPMRLVRKIVLKEDEDDPEPPWRWYVREDGSRRALREQRLDKHTDSAKTIAADFATRLALPEPERTALVCAAERHDLGKRRDRWQRSIGNRNPNVILAKSDGEAGGFYCGYRHELGSVVDVVELSEFKALSPEAKDLVLHVIAAHHGRARPHFPPHEISDPEFPQRATELAAEIPQRFARLQRKYGRWGLAYLESLLRAADALASRKLDEAATAGGAS